MRITTTRTRYFAPSVTPFVESVSLDDFDLDEIRKYLRHKGDMVAGTSDDDASDGATAGLFHQQERRAATAPDA
jgi:hypothetical protein